MFEEEFYYRESTYERNSHCFSDLIARISKCWNNYVRELFMEKNIVFLFRKIRSQLYVRYS